MKTRLIFSLSAALIFLSLNISAFAQEKPVTTAKNNSQSQAKQLTKATKTHEMKLQKENAVINKKTTEKTSKVKGRKILKNEPSKKLSKKEAVHHIKMIKKTQKKESNTPQKK